MEGLLSQIITKEIAVLATAAIAIMLFVGKIPINNNPLNQTKFWKNYGIFILLIVCIGGSFVPGIRPDGQIGNVIIFGILSAMAALLGRQVLKPIVLSKLEGKSKKEE